MPTMMSSGAPEVRLPDGGRLRGSGHDDLAVFRGIPYAEPPVGPLRFAAPRAVRAWPGTREAVSFGPAVPQSDLFGPGGSDAVAGDDWLTINVWSPDLDPSAGLPVLVWIYGGGYAFGASSRPEYDGSRLARDGHVVVVTFNYRLGVEGFAQIAGAPANRGLLDQVAALEWVRDHIGAFGGDPGQVTLFGESAGGGSVAALLAMPRAAGLFRRAIVQSAPGAFFTEALAADIATVIAGEVGLRATAADLAEAEPELLAAAGDEVMAKMGERAARWGKAALRQIHFAPVVDGDVLPTTPWEALAAGAGRGIDLLAGHTRDEQRLFTVMSGLAGQVTPEQATEALEAFAPDAARYRDAYPEAGSEQLYELVHSDWLFRMPSLHLAEAQIAGGGRAHVYELAWPGVFGACHGLDVPLVFGNLTSGQTALLLGSPPPAGAETVSAEMRDAWLGFATRGAPGWSAYDLDRRLTKVFDHPSAETTYPENRSRAIWADQTFPPLDLLNPGDRP
jgi:para-nitrobenzyl esterase